MQHEYDLEIVVPVSLKYHSRMEDFKRYGIFNTEKTRVLISLLTSGETIPDIEKGWGVNVDAKVVYNQCPDYVSNLYRYFLEGSPRARWTMKLDDDSSTDVDGLIANLDRFYEPEDKVYLGASLSRYENVAVGGRENELRDLYLKHFGNMFPRLQHEIECSVMSGPAWKHIMSNEKSKVFLEERCENCGGASDVALPFAAFLSKLNPADLPFATHFPMIHDFSLFGGYLNHIHLVSREAWGDNFVHGDRCGDVQYEALTRSIDKEMTEIEKKVSGNKFLMETEGDLKLYQFNPNKTARIKFDQRNFIWIEKEGAIKIFCDAREIHATFNLDERGSLVGIVEDQKLVLRKL